MTWISKPDKPGVWAMFKDNRSKVTVDCWTEQHILNGYNYGKEFRYYWIAPLPNPPPKRKMAEEKIDAIKSLLNDPYKVVGQNYLAMELWDILNS